MFNLKKAREAEKEWAKEQRHNAHAVIQMDKPFSYMKERGIPPLITYDELLTLIINALARTEDEEK